MFEEPDELYCIDHSTRQSRMLSDLERTTYMRSVYPRMISGALQGRLLSTISKLVKPERILEIGTFTGFSALCLCEGLAQNGSLTTIDNNPEIETLARRYFDKSTWTKQINMIVGDAGTILPSLNDTFDLVFLDADKENYPAYLPLVKKLMNKGSVLLTDNVLWGRKVLDPPPNPDKETRGVMSFNQMLATDPDFEVTMLPLRDGITIARKLI